MKDKIELQQIQVFQACFLTINKEFWHSKEYRTRAANNGQQVAGHDDRPNIF